MTVFHRPYVLPGGKKTDNTWVVLVSKIDVKSACNRLLVKVSEVRLQGKYFW